MYVAATKQYQQQPPQPFINGERKRSKKERPKPSGSSLVTNTENLQLFQVLGRDRISTMAGVAQLLDVHPNCPNVWRKVNVGLAVLTKDYAKKHYSMCLYDIMNQKIVWDQVLYKNFEAQFYEKCPRFITFEGDTCPYALNFSDSEEAEKFKHMLTLTIRRTNNPRNDSVKPQVQHPQNYVPCFANQLSPTAPNNFKKSPNQNGSNFQMPTGITNMGTVPHVGSSLQQFFSPKKKKQSKKDKNAGGRPPLTKEDIGAPTGFEHRVHIGWDALSGFNNESQGAPMDETVRRLLCEIGHNPGEMKKSELKFAQKFINNYNVEQIQAAKPLQNDFNNYNLNNNNIVVGQVVNQHQQLKSTATNFHKFKLSSTTTTYSRASLSNNIIVKQQQNASTTVISPPRPQNLPTNKNIIQPPKLKPPPPPVPPVVKESSPPLQNVVDKNSSAPGGPPPPPPPPPPCPPPPPSLLSKQFLRENNNTENIPKNQQQLQAALHPPPPPPPPPPIDNKANLLQQIQQGANLRKVGFPPEDKKPVPTNPPNLRDSMMEQIKQGTSLKHVDQATVEQNRRSGGGLQDFGGIAGALARALEERRKNIQPDDSSDSSSDSSTDSEWGEDS
uniref:Uncharacterized protein n=1 Tax=Meloidogyne enterolobii TaxID=390850 RepID=A0A6V7V8J8_MELEN|nr:unnamed protein product [Meloidogyne enterolobii]